MKIRALILLVVICTASGYTRVSQIKGKVFGDYFYHLKNNSEANEDLNGFAIRRIYFTFESQLTDNIKMRLRLDSKHGDFGEKEKLHPFIKNAYIEWNNILPQHKLYVGISNANTIVNSQDYWGYRSLEETITGVYKISSSADMGLALKGDLNKYVHHWLTVFNGTGYGSSEMDKYKKLGYSLWITPIKGMILEGYIDYEKQDPETGTYKPAADYFHSSGYRTVKGFIGYQHPDFTIGCEIFSRTNFQSGATDSSGSSRTDVIKTGFSIFGHCTLIKSKLHAFARYDFFDPNSDDKVFTSQYINGYKDEESLIIAGMDLTVENKFHIMPNLYIRGYSNNNIDNDITARITFSYKYKTEKF
ncbi:MAG: hypothetical protein R6V04_00585 [bacterium]